MGILEMDFERIEEILSPESGESSQFYIENSTLASSRQWISSSESRMRPTAAEVTSSSAPKSEPAADEVADTLAPAKKKAKNW